MAIRTTSEAVAEIIEVDVLISLDPFIAVASALVDEVCETNEDADYSEERLELIERWLAAHFYTNRDPRAVTERAGPVSATYQSKVDLNLSTSHYGQTAMTLDTAGGLAALNQKIIKGYGSRTVEVTWLGTERTTEEA